MSVIKQISVFHDNGWITNDIGANAGNVTLSSNIAGSTNLNTALSNILPASQLAANGIVITDANKKLAIADGASVNDGLISITGGTLKGTTLKWPVGLTETSDAYPHAEIRGSGTGSDKMLSLVYATGNNTAVFGTLISNTGQFIPGKVSVTPEELTITAAANISLGQCFAYKCGRMAFISIKATLTAAKNSDDALFMLKNSDNENVRPIISGSGGNTSSSRQWKLNLSIPGTTSNYYVGGKEINTLWYFTTSSSIATDKVIYIMGSFITQK